MKSRNKLSRRDFLKMSAGATAVSMLAACGAPETEVVEEAAPQDVGETSPPPPEEITLKFLSADLGSEVLEWLEGDFAKSLSAEIGVSLEIISTDWGKINETLLTSFAAGDPVDVFEHGSSASGASWAASGHVLALDSYFDLVENKDDYFKVALDTAYFEGKLFSLPRKVSPYGLGYNKDLFEEAGLDPESPPTTWEEIREMGAKMVKKDGDVMTQGGYWVPTSSWDGIQHGWFPYLYQNGASILNEELNQAAFDSPEGIAAIQYYHDLLWEDELDVIGGLSAAADANPVSAGVVGMGTVSAGHYVQVKNNFPERLEQFAVAPATSKEKQATLLAVDRSFITAASRHPEVAWEFLMQMHKIENMTARFNLSANIPPFRSFIDSEAIKGDEILKALIENVPFGYQWPPTRYWNDFRSFVPAMSDAVMAQEGSITETVKQFASEVNAAIEAAG